MFRSLRFRLPAFFLAGIALAGLLATAIAVVVFQGYTRDRTISALRQEARALAALYAEQANRETFSSKHLEDATGNHLFYAGISLFPGQKPSLRQIPLTPKTRGDLHWDAVQRGDVVQFDFVPPGEHRTFLAVAQPVKLGEEVFGALVVATPEATLRSRWLTIMERLALAFAGGILLAGALGFYLSRRITGPVLALTRAVDRISKGSYDVAVPEVPANDEISRLAKSFDRMARRLEEADKLERAFLLAVSHELRTPLTAIRGHVDALREGVASDPASQAASLAIVAAETERLERLVGDILDLTKLSARRFTVLQEEVDMGRLVDQAYAAFSEEARRRRIEYRSDVSVRPVIFSDGDRVLQIISNLLENAFRWTPDGGRIELSLSGRDGTLAVAVSDSGPGIGPEEKERIFRPFWSRDGAGTGLGLAISRELAAALGGRIDLESEVGAGSRFTLVLPGGRTT